MKIQLTKLQLFLLLFVMQTGLVYTSFQKLVIEHGKRDSILQFIVIAVLFYLLLLFYERMHKYFFLNQFTKILYLTYWFIYINIFIIYITHVLTTWITIKTPPIVLIILFLSVCFYASISRPETAINIGVVLLPMLFIFLIFMFLAVPNLNVTNLLPLFYDRTDTWMLGFIYSTYAFSGAETFLIMRKYLSNKVRINKKGLAIYCITLTSFYLIPFVFTLMFFAIDEIKLIPEPILYILHSLEVTFIKRLDLFFIFIWLSWSLVAIVNYILIIRLNYYEKEKKASVIHALIFFSAVCGISTIFIRYSVLNYLKQYMVYAIILFAFVLPVIIILVNKLRGRTVSKTDPST